MGNKVFVGGLSWDATDDDLKELFGECGTEKRVRQILGKLPQAGIKKSLDGSSEEKKQMLLNLEEDLQRQLGTRVGIRHSGKKGEIRIHYQNLDEFDRLYSLLKSR